MKKANEIIGEISCAIWKEHQVLINDKVRAKMNDLLTDYNVETWTGGWEKGFDAGKYKKGQEITTIYETPPNPMFTKEPLIYNVCCDKHYLSGVLIDCNRPDRFGRKFDVMQLKEAVKEFQPKIANGSLFGELGNPEKFDISLRNVSHIIEDLYWHNNKLCGGFRLLSTDSGNDAKLHIQLGGKLCSLYRAAGTVNECNVINLRKLFTFDITGAY